MTGLDKQGELDKIVAQEITALAKKEAEESVGLQNPLLAVEARAVKVEHELSQYVQYAKRRCQEGFQCCIEQVKELAITDSTIEIAAFQENISHAFSRFDQTAYVLELSTQAAEGACWRALLGLNDTTMKYLYQAAKSLFDSGRYPQAEAAFFFLTTIDVSQHAFWLGLGHAAFRLGNLNQSINSYETAHLCLPGSVWPHIYMANCFEAMNDFEEALGALQTAQQECMALRDLTVQQALEDAEGDVELAGQDLEQALAERIVRAKARL